MKRAVLMTAFLMAWTATVPAAHAHFERSVASSRQLALGGALVSVASDASAVVINPAGLTELYRWSVISTYQRPYGVADLDEAFAAAALRVDGVGAVGLAVHYAGLRDVMTESMVTLALARDLIRTSEDASLSVGASVGFARVSAADRFDVSESAVTGGVSVLLRPFPSIGVAYTMQNLAEPEFDLVAGGGKTTLDRAQSWGLSYEWHRRVAVSYERRDEDGDWRDHFGVEVMLGPFLDIRSGIGRGQASGGVGVSWGSVTVDAGFSSHEFLGSSYVVSVGYSPPAPRNPYAQNP